MIEPLLQAERLLLHGMLDQAEELYRRTAEQDPRNAIAVVGLARVCLERGDDVAALGHARAALAIDPDNAAASRLERRLSEVLAQRSESRPESPKPPSLPPAWSSTTPAEPPPAAGPSEPVVFARNPSMAEHRRQAGEATPADDPPPHEPPNQPPDQAPRQRMLDRLLRRSRRT